MQGDIGLENHTLMIVGPSGSGKTTQFWSLEGRKFIYMFDPNGRRALRDLPDAEIVEFRPDILELDATLKGFNKGSKDDRPTSKREPTVYQRWVDDINQRAEKGYFDAEGFVWLGVDSLTFLAKAVMARQLYINNRYGQVEDLADYKIVGAKLSEVFLSITGLPQHILCTGHINTFQDDLTKKIETLLNLPGRARREFPLMFSNVWQAEATSEGAGPPRYHMRTVPDKRGLKDIRCSIRGLETIEDVTIDWRKDPVGQGIQGLLKRS